MAFPQTPLGISVELQINGTWTDVSTDVRSQGGTDAITITRGITSSGGMLADRGTCSLTLDNNAGKYSSRNPMSPYFGYLGRNTPLRVSVAYGLPWLNVSEGGTERASTPDAAVLDITGDLDVRLDLEPAVWGDYRDHPGGNNLGDTELIGKYAITTPQRSWRLMLSDTGGLLLAWSPDGTNVLQAQSAPITLPPYSRMSVRATLDVDNGAAGNTVTFYTSTTAGTSGPWTQLGSPVVQSGTTSIFNGTAPLEVGDISDFPRISLAKKIFAAEVRSGIGGTVVANPNFEAQAVGAASFNDTAPSPRTWTVTTGALTNRYRRFTGEVSSWPPQWDTGGKDVTTPIVASGILQRYGQGQSPLQSTLRRRIPSTTGLMAYWPMEEGSTATQASSPIAGVAPMQAQGFTWAADSSLAGSGPLPQLKPSSSILARLPGAPLGDWHVEFVYKLDTLPASPTLLMQVNTIGGAAAQIQVLVGVAVLRVQALDSNGNVITSTDATPLNFTDGWGRLQIKTQTSGGNVTARATWIVIGAPTAWTVGTTYSGGPGRVTSVTGTWGSAFASLRLGHLAVFPESSTNLYDNADIAFDGETAAARLSRVASEQGLPLSVAAHSADTQLVGPQPQGSVVDVLTAAAQADEGLMHEAREVLGLRYRGLASLCNQASALDLPYTATPQPLMAPLTPVDDDQGTRNDSTVTRINGSSSRSVVTTGPLSVNAPPAGVGTYDEAVTLNLHSDDQTADHASWRTHMGTWDEARFPQVNVELAKAPALIPTVSRVETGSRIRITPTLPSWLPPDAIDNLVLGYTETIAQFSWRLSFACTPYGPYKTGVLDDYVLGRLDTDGSQLAASATTTATTISVATTAGPLWVSDPAETPFDLRIGGEVMTVTTVGQILNSNPDFEVNAAGWSAFGGGTLTRSTVQAHSGVASGLLTSGTLASPRYESSQVTVTAGAQYRAVGWVYAPQALSLGVGLNVNWFDASSVYLSTSNNSRVPTVGVWNLFDAVFTAPASAAKATIQMAMSGTPGAGLLAYGDDIRIIPVTSYTTSPQTLTVVRSVNGVTKAQSSGTDVRLNQPLILAL